jgi:hypothetical protein
LVLCVIGARARQNLDRDVQQPGGFEYPRQLTADPTRADDVAPKGGDPARHLFVWCVNHQAAGVGLEDHHSSAWPQYARHLRHCTRGSGEVLKNAIRATGIKCGIGKVEMFGVPNEKVRDN